MSVSRLSSLETSLPSHDEEVRLRVLQQLYGREDQERLDLILAALGDPGWRIRKEAVNLFIGLPHAAEHADRVVALLHDDENAGLRNAASEILIRLGASVVPLLLQEAATPDHDVRKFVLDILGDIGDEQAIPLLQRLLRDDPEANVRAAAAENLGKLRAVAALPALIETLAEPDLLLRFSLLDALARIGAAVPVDRLIALHDERLLRKPLYDALGRIGDASAASWLLAGLQDPMRNVREAAVVALLHLAERLGDAVLTTEPGISDASTVECLVQLLENPSLTVRRAALVLLGMCCNPARAALLCAYLDDEQLGDDVARILVASDDTVVCSLTSRWSMSTVRAKAYLAYIFAASECRSAIPLLASALEESDAFLRSVLLRAMGQLAGREEIAVIARYLADDESEVRQAAVDGLVECSQRFRDEVLACVDGALGHVDPDVRQAAVQIVGRIDARDAGPVLLMAMKDEAPQVRRAAIFYLDGRNPAHLSALTLALTDEEGDVRRLAVEALSLSDDLALVEPLRLVMDDADPWVRATALRALGRLGGGAELDDLRRGLHDPVGLVTIAALETLAEQAVVLDAAELAACLGHEDDDVVLALLKLLGRLADHAWLATWAERLLAHRHWHVRLVVAGLIAEHCGAAGRPLLAHRLELEEEDLVREHLRELLDPARSRQERD